MQSSGFRLAFLASIPALALSVGWANAQLAVTFVNQLGGDNANACSNPNAPCLTLGTAGGALAKTEEGGVIHVAPGNYPSFAVAKSIEIVVDGGHASIVGTATAFTGGTAGIVVNAGADDNVRIRGFHFDGATIGSVGVAFVAGEALHLEDCTFANAGSFGVVFQPTTAAELFVSHSAFSGSKFTGGEGGGIQIRPTGSGSAKVALDNALLENNHVGILVDGAGSTGGIDLSVADSTISGNTTLGIGVFEAVSGGAPSKVQIAHTTISNNGGQGIFASRSLATVRVRQSVISGNVVGVQSLNGGQIISHGDNLLADNTTNGAFTSTVAPQ